MTCRLSLCSNYRCTVERKRCTRPTGQLLYLLYAATVSSFSLHVSVPLDFPFKCQALPDTQASLASAFLACLFRASKGGQLNFICILPSILLLALTFVCLHLATIARNRLRHWHLWNATFFSTWRYIQLVTVVFLVALFSEHVVRGRVTVSGADSRAASQQWPSTRAHTWHDHLQTH